MTIPSIKEPDMLVEMSQAIQENKRNMRSWENTTRPTFPVYDLAALPADLLDGQIFISTDLFICMVKDSKIYKLPAPMVVVTTVTTSEDKPDVEVVPYDDLVP